MLALDGYMKNVAIEYDLIISVLIPGLKSGCVPFVVYRLSLLSNYVKYIPIYLERFVKNFKFIC